ncbi:hypothetical protein QJS66_04235 [Kocuria rhizophila]|nr:hypothetical protein QJS66_04235 [Kocuria rhizophila]
MTNIAPEPSGCRPGSRTTTRRSRQARAAGRVRGGRGPGHLHLRGSHAGPGRHAAGAVGSACVRGSRRWPTALYFRMLEDVGLRNRGMLTTIVITAGIYALVDFEATPSAIIGFDGALLLAVRLVVVFDKVRRTPPAADGTAPGERRSVPTRSR